MKLFFLTGASGSIGSAIVPLLLKQPDTKIAILLRASDHDHLKKRFTELVTYWGFDRDYADKHIIPYQGDMTQSSLGLDEKIYTKLIKECTHIIHCGGVVRMNLPLDEARKSALGTAREIVNLAKKALNDGQLEKIEYLSTVGVIGKSTALLVEKPVTEPRTFHNTYEQAKAEAEEFLVSEIAENNLPLTIHRPSMVVGDANTGKAISFQVFYHLCEFLSGRYSLGILPNFKGAALDIIPVDYVARAITWSAATQLTCGKFMHECAGPDQALRITELEKELQKQSYFRQQKRLFSSKNLHLPVPIFNFFIRTVSLFSPAKQKKALRTLPFFLNYLDDPQRFGNLETNARLHDAGISKPPIAEFLPKVLSYYIKLRNS